MNSSAGSFTSYKNQNSERAVRRCLPFFDLIDVTTKAARFWQLPHFKTLNVGPAGVWTRDLPLSRPVLILNGQRPGYQSNYTLYSQSLYLLVKSLQLFLEISEICRLVSNLLADNWLSGRLQSQCMISTSKLLHVMKYLTLFSSKRCVIKSDWIWFLWFWNNQGLDKGY